MSKPSITFTDCNKRQWFCRAASIVVIAASGACVAQTVIISPWDEPRLDAMVRIEIDRGTPKRTIGAGFLVAGVEKQIFVITSRHVLTGSTEAHEASKICEPLPAKVTLTMYRRDRDVETLTHKDCFWSLESDIALMPMPERERGYKLLSLATREFYAHDWVYPAGYPNGYGLDATRFGNVSSLTDHSPDELVVASADTFEGVSGGPYLSGKGAVVGVHAGGIRAISRYSHFVSIKRASKSLSQFVGEIPEDTTPKPDVRSLADVTARRAEVGSMLALQALPNPQQRVDVWASFKGSAATAQEAEFLRGLPEVRLDADQAYLRNNVLEAARDKRVELGPRLKALGDVSRQLCSAEQITFEDGHLYCDGAPRLIRASYQNVVITPGAVVVHNSISTNLAQTIEFLSKAGGRAPVHFVVDRDGSVIQLVPANRKAYDAAPEQSQDSRAFAHNAVGIVFMNAGELKKVTDGFQASDGSRIPNREVETVVDWRTTYWHRFSGSQLAAGEELTRALVRSYGIKAIVGMCQLRIGSSQNPGPAFPLDKLTRDLLGKESLRCARPMPPVNVEVR
jgi:N-acetyl-anhydromuramyl-L-alanine amidase AmpD